MKLRDAMNSGLPFRLKGQKQWNYKYTPGNDYELFIDRSMSIDALYSDGWEVEIREIKLIRSDFLDLYNRARDLDHRRGILLPSATPRMGTLLYVLFGNESDLDPAKDDPVTPAPETPVPKHVEKTYPGFIQK